MTAFFGDEANLTELAQQHSAEQSVGMKASENDEPQLAPAEPVLAGKRFFITAPSDNSLTPPGRIRLQVDASGAFGSGRHETTQLVLTALEDYLRPGTLLVDVGCGSGIISAAAHALGARAVISCDIDERSLQLTRTAAPSSLLFKGSVDAIASASAPMIIANISTPVINLLSADLARISKPGALLVLSGFIQGQGPDSVSPDRVLQLNEWQCWICRPESIRLTPSINRTIQPFAPMWW